MKMNKGTDKVFNALIEHCVPICKTAIEIYKKSKDNLDSLTEEEKQSLNDLLHFMVALRNIPNSFDQWFPEIKEIEESWKDSYFKAVREWLSKCPVILPKKDKDTSEN